MNQTGHQPLDEGDDAELFTVDKVNFVESGDAVSNERIQHALLNLQERENNEAKCHVYRRLVKIVENILLKPWDHHKRRIRKTNPVYEKHIATDTHMLEILESLGFVHLGDFIVMQVVNVPYLRYVYRELISRLRLEYNVEIRSLEGHFFDPFKAYMHSSNVNDNVDKEDFELHGADTTANQIKEMTRKLSDEDNETTMASWNPRIIMESKGKAAGKKSAEGLNESAEPKHTPSLLMKMYEVGRWNKFESASKRQLDEIKKECDHLEKQQTVELKIKMPAGITLLIEPPMKTPVARLKKEIQSMLINPISLEGWSLLEMPTRRALEESKTLIQQGISHKVILHFHFKDLNKIDGQILKPIVLKELQRDQ